MAGKTTLELDRDEYRNLLVMLEIANAVLESHDDESMSEDELEAEMATYDALTQKVMAQAEEAGCGDWVQHDEEEDRYYLDDVVATGTSMVFVSEFEEDAFWEGLGFRLSNRDLLRRFGRDGLQSMNEDELFQMKGELEKAYMEEFGAHGLSRLEINENAESLTEEAEE